MKLVNNGVHSAIGLKTIGEKAGDKPSKASSDHLAWWKSLEPQNLEKISETQLHGDWWSREVRTEHGRRGDEARRRRRREPEGSREKEETKRPRERPVSMRNEGSKGGRLI